MKVLRIPVRKSEVSKTIVQDAAAGGDRASYVDNGAGCCRVRTRGIRGSDGPQPRRRS